MRIVSPAQAVAGKSTRERAEALIAIAHPDHRDDLATQAGRTHLG